MGFVNPILGGGGALVRPAIKSPNYVAGVAGWMVSRLGNAEFNDLVLRGTFNGTDYVIDSSGIFLYSGTPAHGNMTGSWAPADGTDAFGNAYDAGLTLYSALGNVFLGGLDGILQSLGSSGARITVEDGQISMTNAGDYNIALLTQNLRETHGSLFVASGQDTSAALHTLLSLVSQAGAVTVGNQDTYPRTATADYDGSVMAHHYVSGALVKASLDGRTGETWHDVTLGTGWATGPGIGGSYPHLRYRRDGEDNVHLFGTYHATSTTPSSIMGTGLPGVNMTTLGGVGVGGAAVKMISGGTPVIPFYLNSAGELRAVNVPTIAVNDTFMIETLIPLGNLA